MAEDQRSNEELPSEKDQKVTPAPEPYHNCSVCGLWLEDGSWHSHEAEEDRDYP